MAAHTWAAVLVAALVVMLFGAGGSVGNPADEMLVVVEELGGQVSLLAADTGAELGRLEANTFPHEVVTTADGRTAYVSNFGLHDYNYTIGEPGYYVSEIDLVHVVERRKLFHFGPNTHRGVGQRAVHGIKLSPDERHLWANTEWTSPDGRVQPALLRYALADRTLAPALAPDLIVPMPPEASRIHNFVFAPTGDALWLQLGPQGVARFDLATHRVAAPFCPRGSPASICNVRGVAFGPDGLLLVSGVGPTRTAASAYNVSGAADAAPQLVRRYWAPDWDVVLFFYASVAPNGTFFTVPALNGQVFVIDYESGALLRRVQVFGLDTIMATVSPDSRYAYATAARGSALTRIDLHTDATRRLLVPRGAGPNSVAVVPRRLAHAPRRRLNVVVVLPLSGDDLVAPPVGYYVKSAFEMWMEQANHAGGLLLHRRSAGQGAQAEEEEVAEVAVTYVDDFSNTTLTSRLVVAALDQRAALAARYGAEADAHASYPHAIFVANPAWKGPDASIAAAVRRQANPHIPLLSVYSTSGVTAFAAADAPVTLGFDRWTDRGKFDTEHYARFHRDAVVDDMMAVSAALVLQNAVSKTGVLDDPALLEALAVTNTSTFFARIELGSDGANTADGSNFPVFLNPQLSAIAAGDCASHRHTGATWLATDDGGAHVEHGRTGNPWSQLRAHPDSFVLSEQVVM